MSKETTMNVLDQWVAEHATGAAAPDTFPSGALEELAAERSLPAGTAARVLALLDVRMEAPRGGDDGPDLDRRAQIARALGACVADVEVAVPPLVEWLSASVATDEGASSAADHRQRLTESCVDSLERLQAPPSAEYEAALEQALDVEDPELARDVEYALERLRAARNLPARRRVGVGLAEAVSRLEAMEAAPRAALLPAAQQVLGWLVGLADAASAEPPPADASSELDHRALLEGVIEDLNAITPAAFTSGAVDLATAQELARLLADAIGGDGDAARELDEKRAALGG